MENSKNQFLDTNTELVRPFKNNEDFERSKKYRHTLYHARETAKKIFTKTELENKDKKTRISFCGFATHNKYVQLVTANKGKFMYKGAASCAAIWRCPVCSMKILKGRAKELYSITSSHLETSETNEMGFLTLTVKHSRTDGLNETLDFLNDSWRKLQNHKFFRNLKKSNYLGQIKALEITHTFSNGWHPHLHIILFWEGLTPEEVRENQKVILDKWVFYTKGSLKAQDEKIVYNQDVSEYVTKWDSIQELTNDFSKNPNGIKPFQLLNYIYDEKLLYDYKCLKSSLKRCKAMFSEYVEATRGKHRIGISRNLNKLYKVESKTDAELTSEIDIEDILLSFEREIWSLINLNDLQPHILDIAHETALKNPQDLKRAVTNNIITLLNDFEYVTFKKIITGERQNYLIKINSKKNGSLS
jgi:hypothetical protein